jgi:hypothetical protein
MSSTREETISGGFFWIGTRAAYAQRWGSKLAVSPGLLVFLFAITSGVAYVLFNSIGNKEREEANERRLIDVFDTKKIPGKDKRLREDRGARIFVEIILAYALGYVAYRLGAGLLGDFIIFVVLSVIFVALDFMAFRKKIGGKWL